MGELSSRLGEADWLDGEFSAGDLMMIMVVRRLENGAGLLEEFPKVKAYVARGEARSAYKRAFELSERVSKPLLHADVPVQRPDRPSP